jgi:signal transduction histidine kinase/ligand-binding sensor domain-containing protein
MAYDTLIFRYNYNTDDFTRFTKYTAPKAIGDSLERNKTIYFTYLRKNGYTWKEYQPDNILVKNLPLRNKYNFLIQTYNKTGSEYIYRQDMLDQWSINDEVVFCLNGDDQDILWVGTYGGGVNKADLKQKKFRLYQHSTLDKNTIIDNSIRAICEDTQGNLWVGTNNKGLTKFNRKQNRCIHFQPNPRDTINSLINGQIRKIYCDKYGYIWIGTKEGLDRFDPKSNKFWHYVLNSRRSIPNSIVFWITEDYSGQLWIGTFNGIARYDRKHDKFFAYKTGEIIKKQQRIRVILNETKNKFWLATDGGGLMQVAYSNTGIEDKLSLLAQYQNLPQNSNSLSDDKIYSMVKDEMGYLWLGTGSGLDRFDPVKKNFIHFNKKNGLPDELIMGILSDNHGNIWISHKRGLTKLNLKTFKLRNYSQSDGLQDNEFSEDAYFKNDHTGELFFGGINGINAFFPDSIKDNPYIPRIVFTSLKISNTEVSINQPVNGRVILNKPLYMTQCISLTYQDKSITLEFAALHYSNPGKNKYAYKLEGFDKDWIYTDASLRIATYSNLEPRTYVFKVKGSNNDGLWNPKPAELKIIVVPPWWKTWWFKIIIILVFILSVYIAFYLRVALYRKKEKELSILVRNRTREISQANEILLERQTRIEEYAEELRAHTDNLEEANDLLRDNQKLIETQAEQLNNTNQQLAILNSTKDRFFAIIAHDLRNPFHTVSGFTEILINDYKNLPSEKIERYLNLIYTSSANGNNLLENLLQWSRSQTGRITFDPARLNLSAIADETVNLLEGNALRKNIRINSLVDQNIIVFADEHMLKTICRNLVSNAIKFTLENGTITIKSVLTNAEVEITVADTGVGIPPENIPKLFQINTTITTKGTLSESGTGLGLILCKEFVEKHNGTIWVESEINKGSEFKFTLPLG